MTECPQLISPSRDLRLVKHTYLEVQTLLLLKTSASVETCRFHQKCQHWMRGDFSGAGLLIIQSMWRSHKKPPFALLSPFKCSVEAQWHWTVAGFALHVPVGAIKALRFVFPETCSATDADREQSEIIALLRMRIDPINFSSAGVSRWRDLSAVQRRDAPFTRAMNQIKPGDKVQKNLVMLLRLCFMGNFKNTAQSDVVK